MAYQELPTQSPSSAGVIPTYTAAPVAGAKFYNDGRTMLIVKNGSGSVVTVTITTPNSADGNTIADKTFTVAATTGEKWWKGEPQYYNQPDGATDAGEVYVDFSAVTTVTIAAVRI